MYWSNDIYIVATFLLKITYILGAAQIVKADDGGSQRALMFEC